MPSRPQISWSDLAGARVGIWGLGVEGRANLRRLRALGVDPVLVDDGVAPADLGDRALRTADGGLDALSACAYVVKSPGIPRYRPEVAHLHERGVAVVGGLGLWLQEADRRRVICVTGTKGKSTTVSILGHLLAGLGRRAFVGGNLGLPPWDPEVDADADRWVIETSSYQATDLSCAPGVTAVTSLYPDHLTWHDDDVERYYRDKLSICTLPGGTATIANGHDERLRARAGLLGDDLTWITQEDAPAPEWVEALGLQGRHNVVNALIARACLVASGIDEAADDHALLTAAKGFEGLDSRLRTIGVVDGVSFVDDSLSTNVLPTIAALDVFDDRPVALLAGGYDRHLDYAPLAAHLTARRTLTLLVALPSSGARIAAACAAAGDAGDLRVEQVAADGPPRQWLGDAVRRAFQWARPRAGVVLLSPAAASFDHFTDYRHRAAVFAEAMRGCGT